MYYHVCQSCNAKFFVPETRVVCPRCGIESFSDEQRDEPWKEYPGSETSSADRVMGEGINPRGPRSRAFFGAKPVCWAGKEMKQKRTTSIMLVAARMS